MQLAKSAELIFPTGSTIRSDAFRENAYSARGERLEMAESFSVHGGSLWLIRRCACVQQSFGSY